MNLAARGARHLGERPERIKDSAELRQVRRQARKVWLQSFASATVLTLLALALP